MKYFLFFISLLFSHQIYAQFSLETEFSYLKLINTQNRNDLIKDNLINLETSSFNLKLIENEKVSPYYFTELSKSYEIINRKVSAIQYIMLQSCLFPNDTVTKFNKNRFFDLASKLKLENNISNQIWETCITNIKTENFENKLFTLLTITSKLPFSKSSKFSYNLILQLKQLNFNLPLWYQKYEFLVSKGVNQNRILRILDENNNKKLKMFDKHLKSKTDKIIH
jgi:hypothetical protein